MLRGVVTNAFALRRILEHPEFARPAGGGAGPFTSFLAEHPEILEAPRDPGENAEARTR